MRVMALGLMAAMGWLTACQQAGTTEVTTETTKPAAVDARRLANADAEPQNWMSNGRGYDEDHFSPLDQINAENVGKLSLAWSYDLDTDRGQEATPIIVDGVMYTSSAWSKVYALDAATGKLLWSYDPEVAGKKAYDGCCDVVNRGVAVWHGKVYVGAFDGRLIALDAATGKPVWSVMTVDPKKPYTITGAPRVVKGKVLIGNGGAELGVRGYVTAYDAETGALAWRFYTAPNPDGKADGAASDPIFAKVADKTWGPNGAWKQIGGGGTVWDAIVYDQDLDQILIGTGNGSPWNRRIRSGDKGDNLFLSSIVALDPETGAYRWHYQETPGESWDFTATQPIILADIAIDGSPRKVLLHAPKNGYFYVIDRKTGTPISVKNFVPVNWADGYDTKTWRPIERPEARYEENGGDWEASPSAFGAHNWHPMAYSPKTGLVYIPAQLVPFGYADDKTFKFTPGRWNLGNASARNIGPRDAAGLKAVKAASKGRIIAWDPKTQTPRFTIEHDGPGYGGILATAGNLIFQGAPDGRFIAYRADNGEKLWSFDGQSGIIAGAASFAIKGDQYVAVMAGLGGSYALSSPLAPDPHKRPNGRVLVFKLGGTAKLPAYQRPVMPAAPPAENWPAATVMQGEILYGGNCGFCHGPSTFSSGVIPDLRRSPALADKAMWNAILVDGLLEERGMIRFSQWLKPAEMEAIRAYVSAQARVLAAEEKGATKAP
ncbi:PQQ-dependent dehydrogenase, methanol/ethanol family [Sphingomonas sp. KC8]|uniref:PQQ-dependent dehydrogenase, methanol/ethanol family n=1 Tax=Sphingomonas sp. KC8 TaxID=1030157 RepID=UPI0002488A87|nr:PQQ-dependent dehydrogenase, methanol/ethanol family [Sphingomonas sp. KC8]ARS27510.1 alcohol dehydrogenase [Sphingomonas sp. KC8]